MAKNVIITSCNRRYEKFLYNHWYRSLKKSVNLNNIDVIIVDYGLSSSLITALKTVNIKICKGRSNGHIVTRRFIDTCKILRSSHYDQVLLVDGGDIIFQKDISPLFYQSKNKFRAVQIEAEVLFNEVFIRGNFDSKQGEKIYHYLKNKPLLNAGFVLGSRKKIIELCEFINKTIINKNSYGPDQVALNYVLHRKGVELLDKKFNFMVNTVKEGFMLINGYFFMKNGELIYVVHNAGHNGFLRPIFNFGYGTGFNRINYPMYYFKRYYYELLGFVKNNFILKQNA